MQASFDTHFWGPIRVLRATLPLMKARKSGTIVYNGSIFGFTPVPGSAMYSCSKAAGEMLSSLLALELVPFNIRSINLNAGMFQSAVLSKAKMPAKGFSESTLAAGGPLVDIMTVMPDFIQNPGAHTPGDATKFAQRVLEIVDGTGLGPQVETNKRVLLGKDAVRLADRQVKEFESDFKNSREIAESTDIDGSTSDGVAFLIDVLDKLKVKQ
jgi:NAD(P)-dependent dehydrogenase (short-subunit alcohol dehydrogenase family)